MGWDVEKCWEHKTHLALKKTGHPVSEGRKCSSINVFLTSDGVSYGQVRVHFGRSVG